MKKNDLLANNLIKKVYPTWSDLLALVGMFIVSTILVTLIVFILPKIITVAPDFLTFLSYVLQFGLIIAYALYQKYQRTHNSDKPIKLLRFSFKKADPAITLWGTILLFSVSLIIEPLVTMLPDAGMDLLYKSINTGGWALLTTVVMAPLLEEILFRGLLQESLTNKYGPIRGILIASAVFGVIHFIPQQAVNAFFVGTVLGYIYYRTQSLIPVIIIHAINNGVSTLAWRLFGEKVMTVKEMVGNDTIYHMLYGIAFMIFIFSLVSISRRLKQDKLARAQAAAMATKSYYVRNAEYDLMDSTKDSRSVDEGKVSEDRKISQSDNTISED